MGFKARQPKAKAIYMAPRCTAMEIETIGGNVKACPPYFARANVVDAVECAIGTGPDNAIPEILTFLQGMFGTGDGSSLMTGVHLGAAMLSLAPSKDAAIEILNAIAISIAQMEDSQNGD